MSSIEINLLSIYLFDFVQGICGTGDNIHLGGSIVPICVGLGMGSCKWKTFVIIVAFSLGAKCSAKGWFKLG